MHIAGCKFADPRRNRSVRSVGRSTFDRRPIVELRHVDSLSVFADLYLRRIILDAAADPGLRDPQNLELVRVVLVEKGDGDAHHAVVVAGDRVGERHFDRVVVVVPVVRRLALDLLVLAEPQVVRTWSSAAASGGGGHGPGSSTSRRCET